MNAANSKLSRTATIRLPVATLATIENLGVEVGTTRHALIKLALFDALKTGRMAEAARAAADHRGDLTLASLSIAVGAALE